MLPGVNKLPHFIRCGFPRVEIGVSEHRYPVRDSSLKYQFNLDVMSELTPEQKQSVRKISNDVDDEFYWDIECKNNGEPDEFHGKGIDKFYEKYRQCV